MMENLMQSQFSMERFFNENHTCQKSDTKSIILISSAEAKNMATEGTGTFIVIEGGDRFTRLKKKNGNQ